MAAELGEISKVNIRKVWPNEQLDFTPWLAREENLAKLGTAVGIELEAENTEVTVGPYSADLLAKDLGTGRYVIIENQFGKTNHDHLGKLITYSSALDASAVIWIAEDFSEEHQKALEWLNDHTTEDVSFYGGLLELWTIDQSRPAISFNVVSRPTEVARQAAILKASPSLTDTKKLQLEFWEEFRKRLSSSKAIPGVRAARPQYWFDVPLGRAGIHLSNIANTTEKRIGVRVYISNRVAALALPQLEAQRSEIEHELGEKLLWNPRPENRDKVIVLDKKADIQDRAKWPEYCDWLVDVTLRFRKVILPRVKMLDLNQIGPEENEESPA